MACFLSLLAGCASSRAAEPLDPAATPENLVRDALRTELSGPSPRRQELLEAALARDADCAAARWQLGHVRQGDQWVPVDQVSIDAPAHAQHAAYLQRRSAAISTVAEHRALAQWCAASGLTDEARLHWIKLLQFGPDEQAQTSLGFNGRQTSNLVDAEELRQRKQRAWAADTWQPVVAGWREALLRGKKAEADEARRQLRALADPAAVPALARVFLEQPKGKGPLAPLFVETVSRLPGPEATGALLQIAAWHPSPKLREQALAALRGRPKYAVVPRLLAAFHRPMAGASRLLILPDGQALRQYVVQLRGWNDDLYLHFDRQWMFVGPPNVLNDIARAPQMVRAAIADTVRVRRETELAASAAAANNQRIGQVLAQVWETDDTGDPFDWYRRWNDYQDYQPDLRREMRSEYTQEPPVIVYTSCFPAGTLVATLAGTRPIETIRPGDRVLSQDVETGRLDYKLVYDVTRRAQVPMVRLRFPGESITATAGHYFWASGRGWLMAKELAPSDRLRHLQGVTAIERVEPAGLQASYNLVVADYNTYFVGQQRLLVHDTMPPAEPTVVVPGLSLAGGPH